MKVADHADCWTFNDEFGYSGYYYQRGLQFGKVIKDVWDCPLLHYYEARMFAGKPGCRDGNCWWLKGIHEAGLEIWIGPKRTDGRGNKELYEPEIGYAEFVTQSSIDLPTSIPQVHGAYPFAARVLPGFHPCVGRRLPGSSPSAFHSTHTRKELKGIETDTMIDNSGRRTGDYFAPPIQPIEERAMEGSS